MISVGVFLLSVQVILHAFFICADMPSLSNAQKLNMGMIRRLLLRSVLNTTLLKRSSPRFGSLVVFYLSICKKKLLEGCQAGQTQAGFCLRPENGFAFRFCMLSLCTK